MEHSLRQEVTDGLNAKALIIHTNLEGLIDHRLEEIEKGLKEKFDHHDQQVGVRVSAFSASVNSIPQIRQEVESECFGLQYVVEHLETRVNDMEAGVKDDLRQEFKENVDAKALDLQVKLEEFIEHRLEDVEEVVKNDVRMAFENASCKFKIDLGWSE